ncbi:MAG: hypothetical protein AAGK74_08195 [Chloroflexota bacterium]
MMSFITNNIDTLLGALWLAILIAAALAPLETMGWWAGWWLNPDETQNAMDAFESGGGGSPQADDATEESPASNYVVFVTGIGGSAEQVNVPMEVRLLERVREAMPDARILDQIYPYSVGNLGLTHNRVLSPFWKFVLKEKMSGHRALGFFINLRNLLQVLVCADDRYGPFFSQGAAQVITKELQQAGYNLSSGVPITIIGYSGGGQIAVGAAPYLAQVIPGPVRVISLGGVLSSTPMVNRIDDVTHIYSDKDTVQRLGMIFPGRWAVSVTSTWNRGKRAGRIRKLKLPGVKHDGPGGYLDEEQTLPDGRSFMDRTVETIVGIINSPITVIPDDPNIAVPLKTDTAVPDTGH